MKKPIKSRKGERIYVKKDEYITEDGIKTRTELYGDVPLKQQVEEYINEVRRRQEEE